MCRRSRLKKHARPPASPFGHAAAMCVGSDRVPNMARLLANASRAAHVVAGRSCAGSRGPEYRSDGSCSASSTRFTIGYSDRSEAHHVPHLPGTMIGAIGSSPHGGFMKSSPRHDCFRSTIHYVWLDQTPCSSPELSSASSSRSTRMP